MSDKKTVTITIDGKKIEAPVDQPILQTALDHGIHIPYFCYFRDIGSDGNCRMCIVEIEKVKKLMISCATYPTEGMVVYTHSDRVLAARKSVLEFILANHPLDCPICDKVGECILQANYFDFSGAPSHIPNPYSKVRAPKLERFSDRILYDAERCIKCSRCTRFTDTISKSHGLGLVQRGVHTLVAVAGEQYRDNYSDCVTDICPVGALTTTHFRFKARVYTLNRTESVCPLCSRGCNTCIQHKHDKIYRVMPRSNPEINKSWMCNAGRDLSPYLGRQRCTTALHANREISYEDALVQWKTLLKEYQRQRGQKVLAIASTYGSDRELGAFVGLFKLAMGARVYFKTDSTLYQNEYPADHLLITDDKNPNRYPLVHTYQLEEIHDGVDMSDVELLVVWGEGLGNSISSATISGLLAKSKTRVLFTPFRQEMMENYDLVIPVPTFVEKRGSFTNVDGKASCFSPTFVLYPHLKDEIELFGGTF